MNLNFEIILTLLVFISGILVAIDYGRRHFLNKKPELASMTTGLVKVACLDKIFEYARAFFPVLLLVLVLRSFLFEAFRIPSSSLEPTLDVGDFILANKFDYGLRIPVLGWTIIPNGEPQRGDIMILRYPRDTSVNFIKRVIGLPGDRISYIDKELYINGKAAKQKYLGGDEDITRFFPREMREENLFGIKHAIYIRTDVPSENFYNLVVPKDHYFVMGDNRDESNDSRGWGFVPENNIVGKAVYIIFSFNTETMSFRKDRFGEKIV